MKTGIRIVIAILICFSLISCSSTGEDASSRDIGFFEGIFKPSDEISVKKGNADEYITFEIIEDESTEGRLSAVITMREKDNYIFCEDIQISVEVNVWYHCGDNDLDKHQFNCEFTSDKNRCEIKYEDEKIINFNGETIKSVNYVVTSAQGHIKPYTDSQS